MAWINGRCACASSGALIGPLNGALNGSADEGAHTSRNSHGQRMAQPAPHINRLQFAVLRRQVFVKLGLFARQIGFFSDVFARKLKLGIVIPG